MRLPCYLVLHVRSGLLQALAPCVQVFAVLLIRWFPAISGLVLKTISKPTSDVSNMTAGIIEHLLRVAISLLRIHVRIDN